MTSTPSLYLVEDFKMKIEANSVKEYLEAVPAERKDALAKLRRVIKKNLPKGFAETMQYDMPSFVVPLKLYPSGYHCTPGVPLPFISFASQKNFVGLYHMGLYSDKELKDWFTKQYPAHSKRKLDMGKSCIRFKNLEHIPYDLIGELASKMTVADWIEKYERLNLK